MVGGAHQNEKVGAKGRTWLKGLHLFFVSAWIGTALSVVLIGFVKGRTPNGDELYAVNASIKLIDEFIIIPAALGTLITGLLFCWLTNWGFFKFTWIKVKLVLIIAQTFLGTFYLGKWITGATAVVDTEWTTALKNQTYLYFMDMYNYFGGIQVLLLIITIFISVFKPWG